MRCPSCAKGSLIEIRMNVGGSPITFRRCGRCEAQGWEALDAPITLANVLDLARAPEKVPGVDPGIVERVLEHWRHECADGSWHCGAPAGRRR